MKLKNTKLFSNLMTQKAFFDRANVKATNFILPAALSLVAAFFEGLVVGLLVPMVKGIIGMDFTFVREFPAIKGIINALPWAFVTPNSSIFILLLAIIVISSVIKNALSYLSAVSIDHNIRRAISNIRKCIVERYFSFGKMFFDKNSKGLLYNILINFPDITAGRLGSLHALLKSLFELIVYCILMIAIDWRLTLFLIVIPPFLYYSMKWLIDKIGRTSVSFTEFKNALSVRTFNIFSCLPLIKLYGREKREKEAFSYDSDRVATLEFSMDKKQRLIEPLQEVVMLVMLLLVISIMAFLFVKKHTTNISGFLVYFYLLRKTTGSFSVFTKVRAVVARTSGPLAGILKVFDDQDKHFVPDGRKIFDGLKKGIGFKRISFFYAPKVKVLKDVSFFVKRGKTTAIVGPTGSGKTTLINLLLRFYDCPPSSILVDGVDIREFTLKSLRYHMALVSQETLLFNDTLKNNITYGAGGVDDDVLVDIAKKTRLYDFVINLPKGFDTAIGDRGVKLSGGEKQRVSIARALLKQPEILILDEATSSLDSITERLIQEAIEEAIKDRTAIVIAHRLSTIKNADKIVVIENGSFVEEGPLQVLLDKKGMFYKYWQEQKFD